MISRTLAAAKQRPVVTMFITLGSVAGAAIAILNFTGVLDRAVVTHVELTEKFAAHTRALTASSHPDSQVQMNLIRQESRCGSVDIQIAILSDVIWRLEQAEPKGQRLVEKRAAMTKLRERRTALKCAELA